MQRTIEAFLGFGHLIIGIDLSIDRCQYGEVKKAFDRKVRQGFAKGAKQVNFRSDETTACYSKAQNANNWSGA